MRKLVIFFVSSLSFLILISLLFSTITIFSSFNPITSIELDDKKVSGLYNSIITADALLTTATFTIIAFNGLGARNSGSASIIRTYFWKVHTIRNQENQKLFFRNVLWYCSFAFIAPIGLMILTTASTMIEIAFLNLDYSIGNINKEIVVYVAFTVTILCLFATILRTFLYNSHFFLGETSFRVARLLASEKNKTKPFDKFILSYLRGSNNFKLISEIVDEVILLNKRIPNNEWKLTKETYRQCISEIIGRMIDVDEGDFWDVPTQETSTYKISNSKKKISKFIHSTWHVSKVKDDGNGSFSFKWKALIFKKLFSDFRESSNFEYEINKITSHDHKVENMYMKSINEKISLSQVKRLKGYYANKVRSFLNEEIILETEDKIILNVQNERTFLLFAKKNYINEILNCKSKRRNTHILFNDERSALIGKKKLKKNKINRCNIYYLNRKLEVVNL